MIEPDRLFDIIYWLAIAALGGALLSALPVALLIRKKYAESVNRLSSVDTDTAVRAELELGPGVHMVAVSEERSIRVASVSRVQTGSEPSPRAPENSGYVMTARMN